VSPQVGIIPRCHASLRCRITRVVGTGAEKQMGGVTTKGLIAFVEHTMGARVYPGAEEVSDSVGEHNSVLPMRPIPTFRTPGC
jgi:hypothetical protein